MLSVSAVVEKLWDKITNTLAVKIAAQDVTLLDKLVGKSNPVAILKSSASIAGTAGATALDWLNLSSYSECWYLIGADVGDTVTGEVLGTGDGSTTSFSGTLAKYPVRTNSVTIHYTIGATAYIATDDGAGNISGTDCSGTIDYASGSWSLTFTTAPDDATGITTDYTSYGSMTLSIEVSPDQSSVYDCPFSVNGSEPYVISHTFNDGDDNILIIAPKMDTYQRLVITPDGINTINNLDVRAVRRV